MGAPLGIGFGQEGGSPNPGGGMAPGQALGWSPPSQSNFSGASGGGGGGGLGNGVRSGVNAIPILGDIMKNIWGDPGQEQKQRALDQIKQIYSQYRPEANQARMTGLGQQLSLFGPVNDMLKNMYGPGAQFDTSKLMQNPMRNVTAGMPPGQSQFLGGGSFPTAAPRTQDGPIAQRPL